MYNKAKAICGKEVRHMEHLAIREIHLMLRSERAMLSDFLAANSLRLEEDVEIVSLTGTLSAKRTHLHIACSREDLTCLGGHLVPGCVVNTTCELVVGVLSGWEMGVEQDGETGYDEIVFMRD